MIRINMGLSSLHEKFGREELIDDIRVNLDLFEKMDQSKDSSYLLDDFILRSLNALIELEMEKGAPDSRDCIERIQYKIIGEAYGFTISTDGEVHGLVDGDMGYEGTGIMLDPSTKAIWDLGIKEKERLVILRDEDKKRNDKD